MFSGFSDRCPLVSCCRWRWADLDISFPTPQVRVRRTLYRPKMGGGWTLEGTKTDKHRTVPLVPQAVAALVRHRERQGVERLVAGDGYADYDFVFTGPAGEPLRADLVSKQFVRAAAAAGMRPMRLYDARHTCATLLLEAGSR